MKTIETKPNFKITNINPVHMFVARNEYQNKMLFINNAAKMIQNLLVDHQVYFVSITYKNTLYLTPQRHYQDTLKAIDQKITQAIVNRPSDAHDSLKPEMILFPEVSKKSAKEHMYKPDHHHGFLVIPNLVADKFKKNCLINYHLIKDVDPDDETDRTHHYYISSFVINQSRLELVPDSFHLEQLFDNESISYRTKYSVKNFLKSRGSRKAFTLDDIIFVNSKSGNNK